MWLILSADGASAGRGVRGQALLWFLRTYYPRRQVRFVRPSELYKQKRLHAEHLLLGLPTSLTPEQLAELPQRVDYRRLALFDYHDRHELAWSAEQEPVLRELTDLYLKPWREAAWDYGLSMGLLPIRRYGRFTWALRFHRILTQFHKIEPVHDVAFVGRPNTTMVYRDGQPSPLPQRVEWIRDLRRDASELDFWGGLVEVNSVQRKRLENEYGEIDPLLYQGDKVDFAVYLHHLFRSRVLLAPGGNVPWTYRHYECLYAGGVVATIDFRERDMLIPLPVDQMVHVPDGGPIVPSVREALTRRRAAPKLIEQQRAHLEQYLRNGAYARSRPRLIERFAEQF